MSQRARSMSQDARSAAVRAGSAASSDTDNASIVLSATPSFVVTPREPATFVFRNAVVASPVARAAFFDARAAEEVSKRAAAALKRRRRATTFLRPKTSLQ